LDLVAVGDKSFQFYDEEILIAWGPSFSEFEFALS